MRKIMVDSIGNNVIIEKDVTIGQNVTVRHNSVLGLAPMTGAMSKLHLPSRLPPLRIGHGAKIGMFVTIYRGTRLGDGVYVADYASIRELVEIGDETSIGRMTIIEPRTKIGNRVRIASNCCLTTDMVIEDDVFLGIGVITANDDTMGRQEDPVYKGAHIKRGARIGSNATLLPGVVIGEDAVVAAGSVVRKNVKDGAVVMGVGNEAIQVYGEARKLDAVQKMMSEGGGFG